MSMQANKRESHWISVPVTQDGSESDWIEHQPIIEGSLGAVSKRTGTSATELICFDDEISDGERFVIRQDAAVYEGTASVTSFQDVEVDRVYGFETLNISNEGLSSTITGASGIYQANFSSDGTRFFTREGLNLTSYTLSTPWDLDSAVLEHEIDVGALLSVTRSTSTAFNFSEEGGYLYLINEKDSIDNPHTIFQLTVSTPFDISTLSYSGVNYEISTTHQQSYNGLQISSDGVHVAFHQLINSGRIHHYTLSTPWDISTASFVDMSNSNVMDPYVSSNDRVVIHKSGLRVYAMEGIEARIYQFSMSSPFDTSTLTYDGISYQTTPTNGAYSYAIAFGFEVGRLVIYEGSPNMAFRQYSFPQDVPIYKQENTINLTDFGLAASPQYVFTQVPDMRVCLEDTGPRCISRDTPMYLYGVGTDQIQVTYSDTLDEVLEAGDLVVVNEGDVEVTSVVDTGTITDTPTYDEVSHSIGFSRSFEFSGDGTKLYVSNSSTITQYTMGTPFDFSGTITADGVSFGTGTDSYSFSFSTDGTKLFVLRKQSAKIRQYILTTPWDIGTATYMVREGTILDPVPLGMFFKYDGTVVYTVGDSDRIDQIPLTTPWDITTLDTSNSKSLSLTNNLGVNTGGVPYDMVISDDGKRIFVTWTTSDTVAQYNLSIPWEVTSGTSSPAKTYDVSSQESDIHGVNFNSDGTRMFIFGTSNFTIYQYTLSSPYSFGGEKIWNVNLPLTITPTYAYIKDRSTPMPYSLTPVAGTVNQYNVSLSTAGSINHTFDSQSFEDDPKRAIQLSAIAGHDTTISTLRANLWKAGTPTL